MNEIVFFIILSVSVSSAIVFQRCSQISEKNETDKVICKFVAFGKGDELVICFKPESSFQYLKIQGFPNTNFISYFYNKLTYETLREDDLKKLNTYVTLGIDRLIPNEWNHLHIKYNKVEPYDDSTEVKVITYTLNKEEVQIKIPIHLNKFPGTYYSYRFTLYASTILLSFNGGWDGPKEFSGKYKGHSYNYGKNKKILNQFLKRLQDYAVGYSSNCEKIVILKHPIHSEQLSSNLPGILTGCTSVSVVALILLLSVLIYKKVRRCPTVEKESEYYEQYPEPYVSLHLKKETISDQIVKETNSNDIQEDALYDENIYDQLEDTEIIECFKASLDDKGLSETTTGRTKEKN